MHSHLLSWRRMRAIGFILWFFTAIGIAAADSNFDWQVATPESSGLSSARLDKLRDELAARQTDGFLLVRNDKIIYEWYAADYSATQKHGAASMSKALIGGLAVAVALNDGLMSLDDPASKFVPQ